MIETLPSTALVLVAILPSPRDLEIARLLGWYRIPLRTAPKVVDVDYLAFYQTSAFGIEERWQVHYTAAVLGHELTTRAELFRDEPDHPRAREEYYKLSLGPLKALPQPIEAGKWKRLSFLYTTGEYLNSAQSLHDLVVQAEERELLWQSLRERALQAGSYHTDELPDQAVDPMLAAWLGALGLDISGKLPEE